MNLKSYDDATRMIVEECLDTYEKSDDIKVSELAMRIMDNPILAMHCPQHHFLIPAVMLTAAYKAQGRPIEMLRDDITEAMLRAKNILPAFCGLYGSCGAAVGLGVYTSILTDSDQYSVRTWALSNQIVGECLVEISKIDGPRCCKRNSFIALKVGEEFSRNEFGLDIGDTPSIKCTHFERNEECKQNECPFFHG